MEKEYICWNCRFWKGDFTKTTEIIRHHNGECHRNAPGMPMVLITEMRQRHDIDAMWPRTRPADWCGDFERE